MKAFGKVLGLFFLGLLLLIVSLGFALTHLFDPNDYKDEIRQIARDKTNLELDLEGNIGWSLFPSLGLELHNIRVASVATPGKPFADLKMLDLSVRVLPLLRKEVQMSAIRVEGLNLNLVRNKQGQGNWENIGKPARSRGNSGGATTPVEPQAPSEPASESVRTPIKLDIDSLKISNAHITYRDEASGKLYNVEGIELSTGAIREGASIPLKLNIYLGSNQPLVRVKTELTSKLRFNTALKRYQLEDAKLSGEVSGEPLQGKIATFLAQGQLLLDQAAQIAEWNGLKLSVNQLRVLGELRVRELDKDTKLSGGLSIAQMNLREFLTGIGLTLPAMADANTLSKFELNTRLAGNLNSLNLSDLKLRLDDTTFNGSFGIADFAKQSVRAQLKGDKLNLDRYLPAKAKQAQNVADSTRKARVSVAQGNSPLPKKPTQQVWSDAPILPLAALRKLDLDIALNLNRLTLEKLPIEDASLKLRGQDGVISIDDMRGELYNGRFNAKANLDVRRDSTVLTASEHVSNMPVERLLEVQGKKSPVKGLLDLSSEIRTSGNSEKDWISHLNGTAHFVLVNGVLLDANLEQQLCQGIAILNRKTLSASHGGKNTPFYELKGSLNFTNGVAGNPDLKITIPGLAVSGNGDIDLRVLSMDYRIGVEIQGDKSDMPDPACRVNRRYVGIEWPLLCRGPLELGAKACRLDKERLRRVAAKLVGDRLNEKLEEKLGDKVSPGLKDALKGLFNRK